MPTPSARPPANLMRRAVLTIVPLVLYVVADQIPMPRHGFLDFEILWEGVERYSVVSLGITPWLIAAGLVEFAALVVPVWSHLRHDELNGRAKLRRAVNILGVLVATVQAYWIANPLSPATPNIGITSEPSWEFYVPYQSELVPSPIMAFVSLIVGAIVVKVLADIVTRRGLIHGFAVFFAAGRVLSTVHSFNRPYFLPEWRITAEWTATVIVCIAVFVMLVVKLRSAPNHTLGTKHELDNPYAPPKDPSPHHDTRQQPPT